MSNYIKVISDKVTYVSIYHVMLFTSTLEREREREGGSNLALSLSLSLLEYVK